MIVRARKTIPNPVILMGITGQFHFQEFSTQTANDFYDFSIEDTGQVNGLDLFMSGDGFLRFQVGPMVGSPFYDGTWTPSGGAHEVHYTVDALGVPTLWVDGAFIPLVLGGSQPNSANATSNGINGEFQKDGVGPPARVTDYFLTVGILPPTTDFCCP